MIRGTQHRMCPLHRDGPAIHADRASDPTQHPMLCSRNRFRPTYPSRPLLDRACRRCLSQLPAQSFQGASPLAVKSASLQGASPLAVKSARSLACGMADAAGPVFQYFWCKERTRIPPTLISPSRWAFGGRLWLGCADFALCDSWLLDQEVRHRFALGA